MAQPIFDQSRPFGRIYHSDIPDDKDVGMMAAYLQDGHYFTSKGVYLHDEASVASAPLKETSAVTESIPAIATDDVADLLNHPAAEKLRALTRGELVKMVMAANGPVVAGEGSSDMMVAWLIKNVVEAGNASAVAKPATTVVDDPL